MSKNRRINSFETIWALGGQSKHSLGPDSVAQLQAMRDLVTPATLAWEREGDLESELARRGFGFLAVFCARRRGDTREDSQEEAAQNEGVRVACGGQPDGPDRDGVSAYTLPAGGGQGEDEDGCRKNWMKREKDTERATRGRKIVLLHKKCRRTSRSQCNISCKRWKKGGTISCLSTKRCKRWHKRYQESKTREKITERKLGGKRRNAESQRRN